MNRKGFLKNAGITWLGIPFFSDFSFKSFASEKQQVPDRQYWINTLTKIVDPVLNSLSKGQLTQKMPVKGKEAAERKKFAYLEAFGRSMAGIAPWLELGTDNTQEGRLRQHYLELVHQCFLHAMDPSSPDYMPMNRGGQSIVDGSLLAYSLLRAPVQIKDKLDTSVKKKLIAQLKASRALTPPNNNHILFTAMIETVLLELDEEWRKEPIDHAINVLKKWYVGDGFYTDGPEFHFDYYNSYIIHPYLLDILKVMVKHGHYEQSLYDLALKRAQRFGACLERLISPEGTFPPIGRSITNRFSAFHLLSMLALQKNLPDQLSPQQVRSGLTAVLKRSFEMPGTFDNGWLTMGFAGYQPDLGESYMNTGSLYGCTLGFIPLGLPAEHDFWAKPAEDWTAKKIWSGKNVLADKALHGIYW